MTRPINEAPLPPGEGTGGSQGPQRPLPPAAARWSLSCHKSLLPHQLLPPRVPGAQSCCLSSAEPELSPPGPAQRPAAPPPPRFLRPSVGSGLQCAPPRAGEAGGECLPCRVPGNSGAITGPRRLPGADCAGGPHQGTRSRHCPGGGEKIAGNLLGNYQAQDLRGVCLPCGPTHEAGGGLGGEGAGGPWSAARCTPPAHRVLCELSCTLPASGVSPERASLPSRPGVIAWGTGMGSRCRDKRWSLGTKVASARGFPSHSLCPAGSRGELPPRSFSPPGGLPPASLPSPWLPRQARGCLTKFLMTDTPDKTTQGGGGGEIPLIFLKGALVKRKLQER